MISGRILGVLALGLVATAACATSSSDVDESAAADSADPRTEDVRNLPGEYSDRLTANIVPGDVGKSFGMADDAIPYPDTYWPFEAEGLGSGGIDFAWQGAGTATPVEKYARIVSGGDEALVAKARLWEQDHHGPGLGKKQNRAIQAWEGHCPGWTAAAMTDGPLKHGVSVRHDAQNGVVECSEGESGCTRFEIGDINALMAEVHVDGNQPLIGWGCRTASRTVDEFDRIKRNPNNVFGDNGAGCKGLNPGALMMVLGTRLKKGDGPFAINAQQKGITDQIWNQPVYRYNVNAYEEISERRAIELVGENSQGTALPSKYVWNDNAKGFALVDVTLLWVQEHGPNVSFVSGKNTTRGHRLKAVIELDRPIVGDAAAREQARIVGGEYLTDARAAASNPDNIVGPHRLAVPTFVWISKAPGRENLTEAEAEVPGFQHHNPFVKPSIVKRLVTMAQR